MSTITQEIIYELLTDILKDHRYSLHKDPYSVGEAVRTFIFTNPYKGPKSQIGDIRVYTEGPHAAGYLGQNLSMRLKYPVRIYGGLEHDVYYVVLRDTEIHYEYRHQDGIHSEIIESCVFPLCDPNFPDNLIQKLESFL